MALMAMRRQENQWAQAPPAGGHGRLRAEGFVLNAVVHPANRPDRSGAKLVLGALGTAYPQRRHVWADQGSAGALGDWSREERGSDVEVVYPWWRQLPRYAPGVLESVGYQPGFHVLPCPSMSFHVLPCPSAPLGRRALHRLAGALAPAAEGL